jgi:hypothetical protein
VAWIKAKKSIHHLDALSQLLSSLVRIKTQHDTIRVLGQVNMLKPASLRTPINAEEEKKDDA